ncbi:MAG: cupin domain-containing protein [Betaproteobacteria bacterium]|nr:cupin domain-containing protein [Betaproteobacteria bacterium]
MQAISLDQIAEGISKAVKPVRILWQAPDTIAFVARGREGRSEFHRDPSDEVMYMIKGDMNLHYLTPENEEKIAVVKQGEIIYCPAGTPHSPRFPKDAFLLVLERKRRAGEMDKFSWYCNNCQSEIFETVKHVQDYHDDPVSTVYAEFYGDDAHRTCTQCGHVNPGRPG